VHPWYVKEQPPDWIEQLRALLLRHPEAGVGEVGLDRWIEQPDVPLQMQFFNAQLDLAHELERPLSIHCLRAWGVMQETLTAAKLPRCGFLLHSYGGSAELVPSFVILGAYFSVSPYFFHPRKAAQLEVFLQVPLDRLLLETDAPDMWPPEDSGALSLSDATGQTSTSFNSRWRRTFSGSSEFTQRRGGVARTSGLGHPLVPQINQSVTLPPSAGPF
jgi:TatD DNase family protein